MFPPRSQGDEIDSGDKRIIRLGQSGRSGFLGQGHPAITGVDLEFLFSFRHRGSSLNLRHPIGQDLSNSVLFRANRARIDTILDGASKRDHPKSKHGDAD